MADKYRLIHGHSRRGLKSPEYRAWANMISRCENRHRVDWPYYGGRGIKVCESWHTFTNFLADMGLRPEGFTIDRTNNNGNYEPANCKWVTHKEQCLNRRGRPRKHIGPRTKDGHFVSPTIRHRANRGMEIEFSGYMKQPPRKHRPKQYKYIGPVTKDGHFLSAGLRWRMTRGIV